MPEPAATFDSLPPRESDGPRPCRRCGYDLEGQRPREGVITCPECGLSGPPETITVPPSPPHSVGRLLVLMCGGTAGSIVLLAADFLFVVQYSEGVAFMLGAPLVFFAVLAGVAAPPLVVSNAVKAERDPQRRSWFLVAGVLAGWATNILIAFTVIAAIGVINA